MLAVLTRFLFKFYKKIFQILIYSPGIPVLKKMFQRSKNNFAKEFKNTPLLFLGVHDAIIYSNEKNIAK